MTLILPGAPGAKTGIEAIYKFLPLPIAEADADSDCFVCEFGGASGANETGAGGGLSGADLVLTQYGSPGSDGTHRTLEAGTYQGFSGTLAFHNNFFMATAGWSWCLRVTDVDEDGDKDINRFLGRVSGRDASSNTTASIVAGTGLVSGYSHSATATLGASAGAANSFFPQAGAAYLHLISVDIVNGLAFAGIALDTGVFPSALGDFLVCDIEPLSSLPDRLETTTWYGGYPVGTVGSCASGYAYKASGCTLLSLAMAKSPCFVFA